ncbi:GntR family transcriptional regulator [Streptomyces sp. NPDC005820]|uniref:GntR family transcriptional regulator n=1 Tax=Streptomyces sp. NPDC005820 TaxID=3157069 RepID=UPI0033DA633E
MQVAVAEERLSLAEQAYRVLCDRLVTLEIAPGTPINDEQVAAELGVGRTPVREALKRLETDRLVVSFPRRGTFASEVQITDLGHLTEVRHRLEPLAADCAARRASARDRAVLGELLEELDAAAGGEVRELIALDLRLHRALYAATANPFLQDTLVRYDNLATRVWCLFLDRLPGLAGHVGEHGPLVRAVLAGDGERAADLAAEHVERFETTIRSLL